MSTDQAPALARATEALNRAQEVDGPEDMTLAEKAARIAVSAALHDPDDPDFGARVLAASIWGHGHWEALADVQRDPYRRMFADMSAAILGEAS